MNSKDLKLSEAYKLFEFIYSDVKEWLRFAESKNAAILALNGATLYGSVRIFNDKFNIFLNHNLGIIFFIFLILAMVTSILSFYPRKVRGSKKNQISIKENLLFYNNIRKSSKNNFYGLLSNKYLGESNMDKYLMDLSVQIFEISRLVHLKNTYFKVALIFTSISYIILVTAVFRIIGGEVNG